MVFMTGDPLLLLDPPSRDDRHPGCSFSGRPVNIPPMMLGWISDVPAWTVSTRVL